MGKRGHTVTVANNGQEAIDLLKADAFDLVLMDVQMPVMDGFEATRTIRQMEAREKLHPQTRSPIPIVAMTAHAMKGDRERCLESGMNGYLSKPIRTRELDEVLAEFFSSSDAVAVGLFNRAVAATNVMNWSEALKSVDGDVELLRVVATALLTEVGDLQLRLATAVKSNDAATVQSIGHMLKGALSTFGAADSQTLAERLERMGQQRNLSDAAECFDKFQIEYPRGERRVDGVRRRAHPSQSNRSMT